MVLPALDPALIEKINTFNFIVFVVLVLLAVARISVRFVEYKRERQNVPILLKRDMLFLTGLALPFLGVLFFRAIGIDQRAQWWYGYWAIGSGAFAIIAVAYWVWLEYFKIER